MSRDWSYDREGDHDSNRERWLVTYADLMTLLLVFFIVMYALSSRISVENFDQLAASLQRSMKKDATPKPGDQKGFLPTDSHETRKFKANATAVLEALVETNVKSEVKVDIDQRGLVVSLIDSSFFDPGSAQLKPQAVPVLKKIGLTFKKQINDIRVEGHTDSQPISTTRFPSNWELSSARATSVVRFLVEKVGLPPHRLQAVGMSSYKPVGSNGTWEGRKRNRRVDIILTRSEAAGPAGPGMDMPKTDTPKVVVTPPPQPAGGGFYDPFKK